jgi:hypothetical protein
MYRYAFIVRREMSQHAIELRNDSNDIH